jgi:hypothetical protein
VLRHPGEPTPGTAPCGLSALDSGALGRIRACCHGSGGIRGDCCEPPPGLAGSELILSHRLGTGTVEVHAPSGVLIVSHRLAPAGAGATVRTPEHAKALEQAVLSSPR